MPIKRIKQTTTTRGKFRGFICESVAAGLWPLILGVGRSYNNELAPALQEAYWSESNYHLLWEGIWGL